MPGCPPRPEALIYGIAKLQDRIANGETSPTVVHPNELTPFDELERDEVVTALADEIHPETMAMRYEGF